MLFPVIELFDEFGLEVGDVTAAYLLHFLDVYSPILGVSCRLPKPTVRQ